MVRVHQDPPRMLKRHWGLSSAGRAPALQAGGQRFDPVSLHQALREFDLRASLEESEVFNSDEQSFEASSLKIWK